MVAVLPEGSLCEHCFCNLDFSSCEGTSNYAKNAETTSEFRASGYERAMNKFFSWLLPNLYSDSTGELRNCIIINYGDAEVKIGLGNKKGSFIDCSDAQAKGLSGDYSVFKNTANFDQSIWVFDNNNGEGGYPTLRYVAQNPRLEVVEEPVVEG